MTASTFQIDSIHGRTVVSFLPPLNEIPWAEIEKVGGQILPRLQEVSSPGVLVDLCSLKYMGSASLALVVRIYKTVTEKKGRLVVANQDPMVGELLTKAGLEKILEIAPSREEGLRRLGLPAGEVMRRAGGWQNVLAIIGLLVSVFGLVAFLVPVPGIPDHILVNMQIGGGVLGFGFALWSILESIGRSRTVGVLVLIASVALLSAGVFHAARQPRFIMPAGLTPLGRVPQMMGD